MNLMWSGQSDTPSKDRAGGGMEVEDQTLSGPSEKDLTIP